MEEKEFDELFNRFFKKFFREFLGEVSLVASLCFIFAMYFIFPVKQIGVSMVFLALAILLAARLIQAHRK